MEEQRATSRAITAAALPSTMGRERCISFGSFRVDASVAAEVIERIQPLGVEAALAALQARGCEDAEKRRQVELALQQARFEAAHARRQYDAVDPTTGWSPASSSAVGTSA